MAKARIIRNAEPGSELPDLQPLDPGPFAAGGPRGRGLDPSRTRVIRIEDRRASLDGEAAVSQARQVAAAILDEAEERAAARAAEVLALAEERAASLLRQAQVSAAGLLDQARGELQELAMEIARKVIGAELRQEPAQLESLVVQVMRSAGQARRFVLRLNPGDVAALEARVGALSVAVEGAAVVLEEDPTLACGDCILETAAGQVDGRIAAQLKNISKVLFGDV